MSDPRPELRIAASGGGSEVQEAYLRVRAADRQQGPLDLEQRLAYLDHLLEVVRREKEAIARAIDADFGGRSRHETLMTEIFVVVNGLRHTKRHLRRWVRPERRPVGLAFVPVKARVIHQPLGVVGVIAPWNYPFQLAVLPLVAAVSAGNRVLLKPSELTPATSALLEALLGEVFPKEVVTVVHGGADAAAEFSGLPLDHLLFTGSTRVGELVMRAASRNLTPVTLELGGKSPTIVHESFPLARAAERILVGKCMNAGQTCIAPDYVLCPRTRVDALVAELREAVGRFFPRLSDSPDYTSIVDERHYQRLVAHREDARARGARVIELNPGDGPLPPEGRRMAPTLLVDVHDEMSVMQEEIFGPLLPIVPYDTLDEAIAYVNDRPRPLALYYFDYDGERIDRVLGRTVSGGACVNDTLLQVGPDDLPFGGVGPSGMGAYHGRAGFETFSHARAVVVQRRWNAMGLLTPPYGNLVERALRFLIG